MRANIQQLMIARRDCRVCGGEGWLDEAPTGNNAPGNNDCNYCDGTGKEPQVLTLRDHRRARPPYRIEEEV